MNRFRTLTVGIAAAAMGLLAGQQASAQSDGYVYLSCDFQPAASGPQPEAVQLKIGKGDWHTFDTPKGSWGASLCRPDFSTGYRGECSFTEARFELVATTGSIKQTTTISRRDGSIVRRAAGKSDVTGVCRPIQPPAVKLPPAKPKQS